MLLSIIIILCRKALSVLAKRIKQETNPAMSYFEAIRVPPLQVKTILSGLTLILTFLADVKGEGQCSSVTTFNAGLTPVVANMDERIPAIISAIKASGSDVFCLQEVWFERSLQSLLSGLGDDYPYHYSAIHKKVGVLRSQAKSWFSWLFPDVSCKKREAAFIVKDVGACAVKSGCVGSKPEEVGRCLADKCSEVLKNGRLSQSCLSCTLFSLSSVTSTLTECNRVVGANNRFNGPGLVLLSKKKVESVKYNKFFPFFKLFVERGYIEAKIQDVGKIVCTHLSAHFGSYFEFDTIFKSFSAQQAAEIRRLFRFRFEENILLGDLNTGPGITFRDINKNIESVYPSNFRRLMVYGYKDPYIHEVQLCTYCDYNRLTTKGKSHILDHVMYKGRNYYNVSARRVMMHYSGNPISDHYGVELRFCRK